MVTEDAEGTAQFFASLKHCEEHPESVLRATNYFTHLSSTLADEEYTRSHGGATLYQRTFNNHQYGTVIAMALASQRASDRGRAPPLTTIGKTQLAQSYMALGQWKDALDLFEQLPSIAPEIKNECRRHLQIVAQSESVPDPAWTNATDIEKVQLAYDCIGPQRWDMALAILDSMGHRTVRMTSGGAWGFAFTPVLPAVVADECRAKAGKPPARDPIRFELGETPFVSFIRNGLPRVYSISVEDEDLWIGIYNQIKSFRGEGPFSASKQSQLFEFSRSTLSGNTCVCVSPDFVWAGTRDDGLMEGDRRSGTCRRLTMQDGLSLNGICWLYPQSSTLWIGYRNGQNGAIGTMDIRSHKFATFTRNLPAGAGTSSPPGFAQSELGDLRLPPQQPVSFISEVEPGELWFVVGNKGLQQYRISDAIWGPVVNATKPVGALALVANPGTPFSALAADRIEGKVALTIWTRGEAGNEESKTGGLVIFDYRKNQAELMQIYQGLPANHLTAVAMDGGLAWVGGRGFVAVVDLQIPRVSRIAYVSASSIKQILLGKKYAWIQVSCGRESFPDAGNAWTGVYRIQRSSVEPNRQENRL